MKLVKDVAVCAALLTAAGALLGPDIDGNAGVIGKPAPQTEGLAQMVGSFKNNDDDWGIPCDGPSELSGASWTSSPTGLRIYADVPDGMLADAWQLDAAGIPSVFLGVTQFWGKRASFTFSTVPTADGAVDVGISMMTEDGVCPAGTMHWEPQESQAGGGGDSGGSSTAGPGASGGNGPSTTASSTFQCNKTNGCRLKIYFGVPPNTTSITVALEKDETAVVFSPPSSYATCVCN